MKIPANDPYCYPGTNVLINKYGIRNQSELDKTEANLTVVRLKQLAMAPLPGDYDFAHFCAVHQKQLDTIVDQFFC
jgi:cell filamentation protein